MCEGKFPGELFDLGSYPGATYIPEANEYVWGNILKMKDPECVLKELDCYEGMEDDDCEYDRKIISIETNNSIMNCWVYIYRLNTRNKVKITGGNYLKYLGNKLI